MSKLSRYNLLISVIRHELQCDTDLGSNMHEIQKNNDLLHHALESWLFLSDDLMSRISLSEQTRNCRIRQLIAYLNEVHISQTLKALKDTYDILISHISGKCPLASYTDFKDQLCKNGNPYDGRLYTIIKESLLSVLSTETFVSTVYRNEAVKDMWICAHYLLYLTKLNFSGVGLENQALDSYLIAEHDVKQYDIGRLSPYIPALQKTIQKWFKDWDCDGMEPRHGGGSVADTTRDKLSKYYALARDAKIDYLYKDSDPNTIMPFWRRQAFERCSKLVFVPKNITKLRSISMEPSVLQYLQQCCMRSIYDYIDTTSLKRHINLPDQHQNRSLAYHGSITNDYATIDLSSASDMINWNLVKVLFRRVPKLLKWLVCTRSTHTLLPNGEKIKLTKFAPMGSALCFPIESILFASITDLGIRLSKEQALDRNMETGIRSSNTYFSVYGDDIICPTYAVDNVVKLLCLAGFKVNNEKSYLTGPFKESCGGNYFCGIDITPIKYSPDLDNHFSGSISPKTYTAYCSYANSAYVRELFGLRLYFIKEILNNGLKPLFTSDDTYLSPIGNPIFDKATMKEPAIFSTHATNFHLKRVYSKRYQKMQMLYTSLKTKYIVETDYCNTDQDIYFFDKCLEMSRRKDSESNLINLNARYISNTLVFDVQSGYNPDTLHRSEVMFSSCLTDVTHHLEL